MLALRPIFPIGFRPLTLMDINPCWNLGRDLFGWTNFTGFSIPEKEGEETKKTRKESLKYLAFKSSESMGQCGLNKVKLDF